MQAKPKPMPTFEDFKLNRQLLNALEEADFQTPTPIQEKAIPILLGGSDLIGVAPTGTGKTAAFLLPLLMKVKYAQGDAPRALILAPTRELILQIGKQLELLGKYTDLRHMLLIGGKSVKTDVEEVLKGVDILVATPRRFMDVYQKAYFNVRQIKTLVMDEADRMLDMGFTPQIQAILEIIPAKKRQNLLFSATMPPRVLKLCEDFLDFPERVEVAPPTQAAETIEQLYYAAPNFRTKLSLLEFLLKKKEEFPRVLLFTRTRRQANDISKFLARKLNEEVGVLHANKDQNTRINALEGFKEGRLRLLVATDIASRGLDVPEVSHVFNVSVPRHYEDYIHRVGRTGRAFRAGTAISLCDMSDRFHLERISERAKQKIQAVEMPKEVEIFETPFEELQTMRKEIDLIRQREDPTYQGAFHERKGSKKGGARGKKRNSSRKRR